MTVHMVNRPGGFCIACGENDEWLRRRGGSDTIEYVELELVAPESDSTVE